MKGSRGVSLIEALIAVGLLSLVSYGSYVLMKTLGKQDARVQKDQFLYVDVERTLNSLARDVYNSAFLAPAEGLVAANDLSYRGIVGVNGITAPISQCKYEKESSGKEKFSIVRYTATLDRFPPEPTVAPWKEVDLPGIRIHFYPSPGPGRLFQDAKPNVTEIILIDADTTDLHRYSVTNVSKDTTRTVAPFDVTTIRLALSKSITGVTQANNTFRFVTDSIVYGAETRLICVDPKGDLIQITESSRKTETLLRAATVSGEIDRFEALFFDSKRNQRLELASFYPFPLGDLVKSNCVNDLLLRLTVRKKSGETKVFERLILLNNYNSNRPLSCG